MNILWLSHNVPYPPVGGVLQRNYNLLREVASRHSVYLIAFNQKGLLKSANEVRHAQSELEKLCAHVEIIRIPSDSWLPSWHCLVLRSLFTKHPYAVNWLKTSKMHDAVQALRQNVHFDLVHCDTIGLAEYLAGPNMVPKVLNHHNVESAMMLRRARNEGNALKKLYFYLEGRKLRKYERDVCSHFDVNLAVSEVDRSTLARIAPNTHIEVIPNGVDTEFFRPGSSEIQRHSIVFAGRLNAYPNRSGVRRFLREVWLVLKRKVPTARLAVVGKNPPRDVRRTAANLPDVEVPGFVEDVRPYLARAEVYICPIWDGGGTRLKLLDAMSMGKAIVCTSIGCEGIEVSPGKDILIADTADQFVDQITRLFDDDQLRVSLGGEARRLVREKYAWKTIGAKLCQLYEGLS